MDVTISEAGRVGAEKHSKNSSKVIQYGTAGFRTKGSDLDHVLYRMGLLAVLRSKVKKAVIGVMITASHNPEEDNGVKLVDPMGEMLESAWEGHATKLANVSDQDLTTALSDLIKACDIDLNTSATVYIARDTRPSSPSLAQACVDGVKALDGKLEDYGILTTPQLHFMVRCQNTQGKYGQPCEMGYYKKLTTAFAKLRGQNPSSGQYSEVLKLDCANGVGALKMAALNNHVNSLLKVQLCNSGSPGKLNYMCGADFVKVQQKAPEGMQMSIGQRCASFDGDADRIVYFYHNQDDKFQLMDGDKIATLVAGYLKDVVAQTGLRLNLGVVQTAYANGSSTDYITNKLQVPVACVPTGVKHLHHKAMDFDIGVYFEANGHGTVLFSDSAMEKIQNATQDNSLSSQQREAAEKLTCVIDLINQTVGDAISDMLLVENILHSRGWNIENWNTAYTDLPNRQLKVKVQDRTAIQTTDAERKTTSPAKLQPEVDALVAKYKQGRAFVRPSGTEDVVRVYAEADTQANADMLAHEVSVKVYELAGGTGERPSPPS